MQITVIFWAGGLVGAEGNDPEVARRNPQQFLTMPSVPGRHQGEKQHKNSCSNNGLDML